ncbi:MAG TPA: hypothetical protein VGO75_15945, partial [Gemmatimonadaceae bacterium]|nr:hypothetical protein [Gemmatimonadaceae bacterium]
MPETIGVRHPWVRPVPTSEQRAREIEELEHADRQMRRHAYARFGLEYLIWFALGLAMMFWSFRTGDARIANPLFWGGMIVGDAGMLMVLVRLQ